MNTGWTYLDWLQYVLSFALVIGLLLALLWTLRKLQNGPHPLRKKSQRLQAVETLSIGPRQKIVLLQLDGQDVLVGVTAHQMTALTAWPAAAALPSDLSKETPP